ncbi:MULTISPECIES: pentapeptide repeat-containing protein [Nostoc]|uniref:Pentapeptide repeat-containing protein n=1 Tax=Nostoc paludosum FACHB-159 TaxID=2692908 RepID=A0ABR8K5F7_9NOSO|nr:MULTISPECIES: pentapeptide repeat-containing protein [Nostoc]MBD2677525.1 pentapeptide repeat-containing protein [Nostoc sp. FACHB-857]MBD2734081.1 pentapeptide repeat-containing protein [Nostoc paludosum FACHB-159]
MQSHHLSRPIQPGQNIQGWRFSQESLQSELRGMIAGQPLIVKALLLLFINVLYLTSGIVSGFFGANVFFNISIQADGWIELLWMIVVVTLWIITTIRRGIAEGLKIAFISFLIALFITALLVNFNLFTTIKQGIPPVIDRSIQNLAATTFGMLFATISLLAGSLAFALSSTLSSQNKYLLRVWGILAILFSAIIIAVAAYHFHWLENKPEEDSFLIRSISISGGIALGFGTIIVSLIATNFHNKHRGHLDFLRDWAIAVASWGGTSFYNLDLSHVDFTGSQLANSDLRARKFYRTCFKGVTGLDRARLDNRYLDLINYKVQKLLTKEVCEHKNFSRINLQGAYLRDVDMRDIILIETNLNGADLQGADLRRSILVRAQVTGANFTRAKLTGICIEDWSINSQTCFAGVECEYIYRKLDDKGESTDKYPVGRNFEKGEFEALFQKVEEVVELVFKEGINWQALSFAFRKLQLDDEGLGLELKGVEQRGDLWVVKVAYREGIPRREVEQKVNLIYEDLKTLMAVKEQQINRLLGIAENQAQALNKRPFGNSFFIVGSTITNLAGSGEINYDEAASKIRSFVANGSNLAEATTLAQSLLEQFQSQSVAISTSQQSELIQQVILNEAKNDPFFKQFLLQQGQEIANLIPESAIATAIQQAYSQLRTEKTEASPGEI